MTALPETGLGWVVCLLRDRRALVEHLHASSDLAGAAKAMAGTILLAGGAFGAALGAYRGGWPVLFAGLKLPLVLLLTACVCAPVLTALKRAVTGTGELRRDLAVVLASLALASLVQVACVPFFVLALQAGAGYHGLISMAVAIYGAGGLVGLLVLREGQRPFRGRGGWLVTAGTLVVFLTVVFVALPVVEQGRLLGAVIVSRTPMSLTQALYVNRVQLALLGAAVLALVLAVSLLTSRLIARPVRALMRQVRRVGQGEWDVMAPLRLETIVGNLVDNAFQHAGPEADVRIAVSGPEGGAGDGLLEIAVSDDGPGVSEANRGRVFEAFFTTARERGGSGLGLPIVAALVRSHGGDVRLVEGARGAVFRVGCRSRRPGAADPRQPPASRRRRTRVRSSSGRNGLGRSSRGSTFSRAARSR